MGRHSSGESGPVSLSEPGAALVTGGAKRIGQAIVLALARMGYDIALHHRSTDPGSIIDQIKQELPGRRCVPFQADLADVDAVQGLISRVTAEFPNLTVLVNNASVFLPARITDTGHDLLMDQVTINFTAPFLLSRDFARTGCHGVIINMLDTRISTSTTTHAAYLLSKKALAELTLMAAREFAPHIRVNGIAPGLIMPPEGENEAYLTGLAARVPLQRPGDPDRVVDALRFIIQHDYLTGQIIYVDGGQHIP